MIWILAVLSIPAFANTFEFKGPPTFSLVINSRTLSYTSLNKQVEKEIKRCNLPVVRALNAELMAMVPATDEKEGLPFQIDGNSHLISPAGKEARELLFMDERMKKFEEEEKKACKK